MKQPWLFAVGDIHGNIRALDDLLPESNPNCRAATCWFFSDYIDRGPDARECVARIIELKETSSCSFNISESRRLLLKSYRDPGRLIMIIRNIPAIQIG